MMGMVIDFDGKFLFNVIGIGDVKLIIFYIGYIEMVKEVILGGGNVDLGIVVLGFEVVGLVGVEVIVFVVCDCKILIVVFIIFGVQVEVLVGNQEYFEIFCKIFFIYVIKEGGGFGDFCINVCGFDQCNIVVMINGILVNDMENGWVYWFNWVGLFDVISILQVQCGLGVFKLVVVFVGGLINIIIDVVKMDKGGVVSLSIGNDGFQKYGLVLFIGLGEKGWVVIVQFIYICGDGYVDGIVFCVYFYFVFVQKIINNNYLILVIVLGVFQWYYQCLIVSCFDNILLCIFVDFDDLNNEDFIIGCGICWNYIWGILDGEEFNFCCNFYHKFKVFINYYWIIFLKIELKIFVYVSIGCGGGIGFCGCFCMGNWVGFDFFSGFGEGIYDENGQVCFDDIVVYN